jgi:hypothetical protein
MMTGCWLRSRFSMSLSTMTTPSMRISWLLIVRCSRSSCLRMAGSWDSLSLMRWAVTCQEGSGDGECQQRGQEGGGAQLDSMMAGC